ncbi:helicase-related protein [Tersicoccus sp. MR15.9]|uniref:helicase-related protein n=1 Tax=Tersicoccus mangrovi TaxID=3121635 RepID=UPI002FE585E0
MAPTLTAARAGLAALTLAHQLAETGAVPSREQADVLAGWTGWGSLSPAFAPDATGGWSAIAEELAGLLTDRQLHTASTSLDVSFFTPHTVIDAVYDILTATGFTGGRVLEPGCGTGAFMHHAPAHLDLDFVGVERDETSALIAGLLAPNARILTGALEDTHLAAGSFDAVIGNVPFAAGHVYDPAAEISAPSLHEFFLRKSLHALRPGGYLIALTSRHTMDSDSLNARILKPHGGQFVAAIRLPREVFAAAGADVISDIVIIRRAPAGDRAYASPRPVMFENTVEVNGWWEVYPELVVGRMQTTGQFRWPLTATSTDVPADLAAAVASAKTFVANMPWLPAATIAPIEVQESEHGYKEGSFQLLDGVVHKVTAGALTPVARPGKKLLALIGLREAALALLAAETDTATPDADLDPLRTTAREAYEAYAAAHGPINAGSLHEGKTDPETGIPILTWRPGNLAGFRSDPDFHLVASLERYDQETGAAGPAPILLHRVNRAPVPVTRADTPAEALAITLGETGTLDLARVAGLLGMADDAAAVTALGDLVFADPAAHGAWTPARDYLAGNVRAKLAAALAAAATDPAYERNVTALTAVVPADRDATSIRVNLGAPWLRPADFAAFAQEAFGLQYTPTIEYVPALALWDTPDTGGSAEAKLAYGTPHYEPMALLKLGLNNRAPVVKTWDGHKDPEATAAAQEKLDAIRDAFAEWIWTDAARADRVVETYNDLFRSHVARRSDGSHLVFPGMSTDLIPHRWQRDIVDQIMSSPATLCGHVVGSGKTISMALAAVKLRQTGLANKPGIIVPNHLLEQISREMQQAFPAGKFLIATKEDLTREKRRAFAARCATGDWDAVVMTHQAFTSLPVHPMVEEAWFAEKMNALTAAIYETGRYGNNARAISRKKRSYEGKLERMRANALTDTDQVFFEQLGIDFLAVDEAHAFRRLDIETMSGWAPGASKRSTDLLLKVNHLRATRPGKPVLALFTGTPLVNSLTEIFVWQTFVQPEALAEAGLTSFDAWAATFVKFSSVIEVSPEGGSFRTVTRPVSIRNAGALRSMFLRNADILTAEDIGLERPAAATNSVTLQQTPAQRAYTDHLVTRAEQLRHGGGTTEDNMLAVCGDGRKVALDPALVGLAEASVKVEAIADAVAERYRAGAATTFPGSTETGTLQLVFCDLGTPSQAKGSQTYGRIRAALIDRGVPAGRIRFIHESADDKSRASLFAACRAGAVSVLLGSTMKMGTGTNVQARLSDVHHADAPWTPADYEQREGRALRPGNGNATVTLHRYVVEGTFDAYMWQTLERKALAFRILTSAFDDDVVELDDITETAPTFTQMKALASGNPLLLAHAEVADEVKRLRVLRAVDTQSVNGLRKKAEADTAEAASLTRRAERIEAALPGITASSTVHDRVDVARRLGHAAKEARADRYGYGRGLGYRGLEVSPRKDRNVLVLALLDGYREIGTLQVGGKSVVGNVVTVGDRLLELVDAEIDALPESVTRGLARASELRAEAAETKAAADAYRFSRQDELDAAEAELAQINRKLEAAADQTPELAAA